MKIFKEKGSRQTGSEGERLDTYRVQYHVIPLQAFYNPKRQSDQPTRNDHQLHDSCICKDLFDTKNTIYYNTKSLINQSKPVDYPDTSTQSKKNIMSTPNIFATSHRLPFTLLQYFRSSLCAPCTFSTTSSVSASIRCICSPCSVTICANWVKMPPSSFMVRSMVSIASPRAWM